MHYFPFSEFSVLFLNTNHKYLSITFAKYWLIQFCWSGLASLFYNQTKYVLKTTKKKRDGFHTTLTTMRHLSLGSHGKNKECTVIWDLMPFWRFQIWWIESKSSKCVNPEVFPLAVQKHMWCYLLDVLNQKSHKKQLRSAWAMSAAHGGEEESVPLLMLRPDGWEIAANTSMELCLSIFRVKPSEGIKCCLILRMKELHSLKSW